MELSERLGLCPGRERIVSIVGAGGKTTLMYALAGEYARRGLRVVAGTTTHILRPAADGRVAVVCDGDPGALERALAGGRIAVAGTPARGAPGKLAAPAPETLAWLAAHTDALFLEADGSRRLPVKFPNPTEPVIPEGTGRVIAVAGLSALGRPFDEVCHRAPLAREALGIPEGASVTPGIIARLLLAGYGRFSPTVLLNQADTPALREQGEQAAALLRAGGVEKVLILSLRQEAEITC